MKNLLRNIVAGILEGQVAALIKVKQPMIVAVTGSVGKTSTKLAIAEVLRAKYKVLVHEGNYNSQIGLPLSIFGLETPPNLFNPIAWVKVILNNRKQINADFPYDAWVLEMGADQPEDITKFMRYIQPDIGVLTAVQLVHAEQFDSIEAVLDEKAVLAHGSKQVLLNIDDERLEQLQHDLAVPVQTYALNNHEADLQVKSIVRSSSGTLNFDLAGKLSAKVKTQFIARHSLYALVAAAAVAKWLEIPDEKITQQLESIKPFKGRMNLLKGKHKSLIIDDTYNASPKAAVAALDALAQFHGRRIAILGNMNELGEYSQDGHAEVGAKAAELKIDFLVTIGEIAGEYLARAAEDAGLDPAKVKRCNSPYEAGEYVLSLLQPGDVVLAKGSQNGVFAEEAVAMLLANPGDKSHLVRQSPYWQKRKNRQFNVK